MRPHPTPSWAVLSSLLVILALTLVPTGSQRSGQVEWCLICGARGLADALLNVILFVPLGAALTWRGHAPRQVLALGALLSGAIEVVQLAIPGRETSLGDLVFNVLGAAAGILLVRAAPSMLRAEPRRAVRLGVGAAASVSALFALTGYLLGPAPAASRYQVHWTPVVKVAHPYRGRVLAAHLGALDLPDGAIVNGDSVIAALLDGAPLRLTLIVGPQPPGGSPIFGVYDESRREIVEVGVHRDRLIFHYRTRASRWRFDQPELAVPTGMAWNPGDSIAIAVRRRRHDWSVTIDGETSEIGFGLGMGWALLFYSVAFSRSVERLASVMWIACVILPVGFWSGPTWESVVTGVVVAVALTAIPGMTGLVPVGATEILGAAIGLAGGILLRRRVLS